MNCGVQMGIPLNEPTLAAMEPAERKFWEETFFPAINAFLDANPDAEELLEPTPDIQALYCSAITEHNGRAYCQIRQLEQIINFQPVQ